MNTFANSRWQKWRFSAPQTHLWLIKHWFSASTFVVKIATFAKPENISCDFTHILTSVSQRTEDTTRTDKYFT
jgi:hypothetical protein